LKNRYKGWGTQTVESPETAYWALCRLEHQRKGDAEEEKFLKYC